MSQKTFSEGISSFGRGNVRHPSTLMKGSKIHASERHQEKPHKVTPVCQVLDESGRDITPRPMELHESDDTQKLMKPNFLLSVDVTTGLDYLTSDKTTRSRLGPANFMSAMSLDSPLDDDETISLYSSSFHSIGTTVPKHSTESEEAFIEKEDLDISKKSKMLLTIVLKETDTVLLFDEEGILVNLATEEGEMIQNRNLVYKQLLLSKESSDAFSDRPCQTFNYFPKVKATQTSSIQYQDETAWITNWKMYDCYLAEESSEALITDEESVTSEIFSPMQIYHSGESGIDLFRSDGIGAGGDTIYSTESSVASSKISSAQDGEIPCTSSRGLPNSLKYSEAFKETLFIVDRMLSLNLYQKQLSAFKGFPILEEPIEVVKKIDSLFELQIEEELSPENGKVKEAESENDILYETKKVTHMVPEHYEFEILWSYSTSKLRTYPVNCVTWNPGNSDLLAVGYGDLNIRSVRNGFACCWSLKNLKHPERIFKCKYGVSALAFSNANPALLAIGLANGIIGIWNIQEQQTEWIVDNSDTSEIPIGAIWELNWLMRLHGIGDEKKEVIISACEDGRVCQWILRKTMECVVLMRLKRQQQGKREWKKLEAMVSRNSIAYCIAFRPGQDNIYLVGTGEGNIQECSCSNSDQFINTYTGHSGPVYCVAWSPFADEVFISSSADWTLKLWLHQQTTCVMTLSSSQSAIIQVCWSPIISTVFACIYSHSLEIWDLNITVLDPVTVYIPDTDAQLTTLKFTNDGRALIVGDSDGRVTMFLLKNFPSPTDNQHELLMKILKASTASIAEELELMEEK